MLRRSRHRDEAEGRPAARFKQAGFYKASFTGGGDEGSVADVVSGLLG